MLSSCQVISKLVFYYGFNFLPERVDKLFFVKYNIFNTLDPLASDGD